MQIHDLPQIDHRFFHVHFFFFFCSYFACSFGFWIYVQPRFPNRTNSQFIEEVWKQNKGFNYITSIPSYTAWMANDKCRFQLRKVSSTKNAIVFKQIKIIVALNNDHHFKSEKMWKKKIKLYSFVLFLLHRFVTWKVKINMDWIHHSWLGSKESHGILFHRWIPIRIEYYVHFVCVFAYRNEWHSRVLSLNLRASTPLMRIDWL